MSSILGVGGGLRARGRGPDRRAPRLALAVLDPAARSPLLAAVCTWRYIPESPVRSPGQVNWLAAALMAIGISAC